MQRRSFIGQTLGSALRSRAAALQVPLRHIEQQAEVFIERDQPGLPHKGKVLAAIQPHNDDVPLFAAGTVLKLIREGYTGILIRTTNDEAAGRGATVGEVVLNNEKDNFEVARLFRLMKVDTVICYDPWAPYEENPDHYVTAQCVEAACWMAAGRWDFPEHLEAGIQPHGVREKYYFARGPQLLNRVVDISSVIDQKVEVNLADVTQGPAGHTGAAERRRLAQQGLRLPLLGNDDDTANRQYIKEIVLRDDTELGKRYRLQYAESFHYIGPDKNFFQDYVKQNAVPL